jgi:ABC-type sugar transport system permease subunit
MQVSLNRSRSLSSARTEIVFVAALFLLPTFAGLLVFHWWPLAVAIWNSTLRFSPLNPNAAVFIGLDNYTNLFSNERFQRAMVNTLIYIFGKLILQIPLGLGLALLLNRNLPGTRIVRGGVFAALVASEAIVALLWNILYTPDNGLINVFLGQIGIPSQPFLTNTLQALPSVLVMIVWKDIGFTTLILLAGLQTIPHDFHEAAEIDGAGPFARLIYITLPLLKRMLLLATFMATISGSRIFIPIALMTDGGPENATVNAVYFMYEQAFKFQRMGEASATAMLIILLLVAITLVQAGLLRTDHEY